MLCLQPLGPRVLCSSCSGHKRAVEGFGGMWADRFKEKSSSLLSLQLGQGLSLLTTGIALDWQVSQGNPISQRLSLSSGHHGLRLFPQWSFAVATITEIPPVIFLPNFLVQRKVLKPLRTQTGGTIMVGWDTGGMKGWAGTCTPPGLCSLWALYLEAPSSRFIVEQNPRYASRHSTVTFSQSLSHMGSLEFLPP